MKPLTKKPQQKSRLLDKAPPPPTRSAPQRLILRFPNSSVIKNVSDPQRLRDSLNDVLKGALRLRGVNLSRGGNLVLHTQAPYTAVQLREHEQAIWSVVRPYFMLVERDRPRFHLDKPWQRVVVHRVPATTSSTNAARRFLREGVFLSGSHCRVSVYDRFTLKKIYPYDVADLLHIVQPTYPSSICFSTPPTTHSYQTLSKLNCGNLVDSFPHYPHLRFAL
ncbi:hypothetical protein FB451DRAFT_1561530 [Mycena latifolia]|nr:hypothetical protein FB451DRAFT_1561530 [Mycena latifolia]